MEKWEEERLFCERLSKKDETVIEEIMRMYTSYVTGVVGKIIGSYMTAEDREEVVNDVFYSLWQHGERIDGEKGNLKAYLTGIARNAAKNKLRECKNEFRIQDMDYVETGNLLEHMESEERKILLKEALERMKEEEREVFLRYYYLYESTEEIGNAMHIRRNTVKSILARGRKKLKRYLTERGITQ